MAEAVIREYCPDDVPELIGLWITVFGDTESFCRNFFEALPDMGSGVVAELDGRIVGAAYTLNGQELIYGTEKTVVGYIYGVAVFEEYRHRGIGERLVKAVYELSERREAKIVTTLPAEKSLYAWYERLVGLKCSLRCEKLCLKACASEAVMPLSSTEYMIYRENMLRDVPHIHPSNYALEFERQLLCEYGGGFYLSESGLCAAYSENGRAIIREVISASSDASLKAARAVGAYLGADECEVRLPSLNGTEYVASDMPLPPDCVWNLTFD